MRRRLLPHPLLSIVLLVVWLLLANSVSLGNIFLGTVFGILIPLFTHSFWPEYPRIARPDLVVMLTLRLLRDIVLANFTVARQILSPVRDIHPDFVEFPLDLENEFAITILASLISLTPGTVSSDLSEDRRILIVHALDVNDKAALIAEIKSRYEQPLREIFE